MPKNFDYYAGGHVHIIHQFSFKDHKNVVYPGPLFPANFEELEDLGVGGFYICEEDAHGIIKMDRVDIPIKNVFKTSIDSEHKTPEEVMESIYEKIKEKEFSNTIVLLRIAGKLKTGKVSGINFKEIFNKCYTQGAFFVMRNTVKVVGSEYEEIDIDQKNPEDVEEAIIKEHLGQIKVSRFDSEKELRLTREMMHMLSSEKHEGEKVYEYEERVKKEVDRLLEL